MNNKRVEKIIEDNNLELKKIRDIIKSIGPFDSSVSFLTKYALIKACGSIEVSFKAIISDFVMNSSSAQIKKYISISVIDSAMNPCIENICNLLNNFDDNWCKYFKDKLKTRSDYLQLIASLKSLKDDRNAFAHGGNPTVSFDMIAKYYEDSKKIIEDLDSIIV